MNRFARPFLSLRPFRPALPILQVRHGLSPIAKMETLSDAAEGKPTAWHGAGAAEFDMRSDTMTKPTPSMLEAICQTTLLDDVFEEDPATNDLQSYVAKRTGHEASLLVMSGTMGNQVSIRTHLTEPPYSVVCDHRSHIICYEAGGVSAWTGATVLPIVPKNGIHLTLEDVQKRVVISDNIHTCPTKLISLENTLDGMIMPLDEARRMTEWAHANGIKVHLDGARLWEAVASGAGSLADYTSLFDSISLCFSKGLGAPIGSIIVGSEAFIKKARWFRKSIGGGARQTGVLAAAARVALDKTFGLDPHGQDGKLVETHAKAKRVADMWASRGGKLAFPVHTNMVWLDIEAAGLGPNDLADIGKDQGLRLLGNRIVIHYQVSDDAISRLEQVFDLAMKGQFQQATDKSKPYGSR
ncbi:Putative L-allo-threonine aldolase [Aspergillus calidoustus]|uniref:Putative L-allo-threonine aldolase n=1 Tax=Aspergillus calidoustus TaxID=454130 RepID=A0A0U5G1M7_ASPCI|nr:Putative L-allo-threonine aldolase [Aspergillus calidoustus]